MKLNLIIFSSILFILMLIWKPLIVFFIPGILIFYLRKKFIHSLGYCIALSLSFWIISAWFLRLFNFSLTIFVYIISLIILLCFIFNIKNNLRRNIEISYKEMLVLFIFLIILSLRLIPFFSLIVAPGPGDMAEHAYPSILIVKNDGLPSSYEPIIPIKYFGTYAVGFHTISALVSILSYMPVYRANFLVACLIYFLINLSLFILLNKFFNKKVALITSIIALFLTTYPQLIFHWGGNPTSFSFFFILIGFSLIVDIERMGFIEVLLASFVFSASLLTHINPFLTFFYVYGFFLVYLIIKDLIILKGRREKVKNIIKNVIKIGIVSFFLIAPYLIFFELGITENELTEFSYKYYDHSVFPSFNLGFLDFLIVPLIQSIAYTSLFFFFIALAGFLILKKTELAMDYFMFTLIIFFMIINTKYWILPLSFALMSDRISLFFIIPFSIFAAAFLKKIIKKKKKNWILVLFYLIISISYFGFVDNIIYKDSPYNTDRSKIDFKQAAYLSIYQFIGGPAMLYMFGMEEDSLITEADLDAFGWIEKNTNQSDIFLNDVSGKYIPAVSYRPVLFPHIPANYHNELYEAYNLSDFYTYEENLTTIRTLNFDSKRFYSDINNLKERNVKYVYIGKEYFRKRALEPEMFENKDYLKVYDKDGVRIYKVVY